MLLLLKIFPSVFIKYKHYNDDIAYNLQFKLIPPATPATRGHVTDSTHYITY